MANELEAAVIKGVIEAIKDLSKELTKGAIDFGKREAVKIQVDLETSFTKILDRNYKSVHRIKTLANPGTSISLESVYVSPDVQVNGEDIKGDFVPDLLREVPFLVITAIAGSGKSMFLRNLYTKFYVDNRGKIPVYVELRLIPEGQSILDYISASFQMLSKIFSREILDYSLGKGKYILLFDGFDEVPARLRADRSKEINSISFQYEGNYIVVSSRPDGIFSSWSEFDQASICALTKEQSVELLRRLNFNKERKKKFIQRVEESLYSTHRSYLSNPLLCTIMLLTFDQKAEIPSKMHIFYKTAFEALLFRHDTQKSGLYKREYKTGLGADEFTSLCASFSTFSYVDFGSSMLKEDALTCARKAIAYDGFNTTAKDVVADLCTSISITVEEGGHISYIHRSFQEYLTAFFIANREIENWDSVIERMHRDNPNDSVISLVSNLNPDKFRDQFLAPRIKAFRKATDLIDINNRPGQFFDLFYITLGCSNPRLRYWVIGMGEKQPPWTYLSDILQKLDLAPSLSSMPEFNWQGHVRKLYAEGDFKVEDAEVVEPHKVTNDFILTSPLFDYLKMLRQAIIDIDIELSASSEKKKVLLSDVLLKSRASQKTKD